MSSNTISVENSAMPVHLGKHAKYFIRFLHLLPGRLASHDSSRVLIAFFAVCGLDVLNSLYLLKPDMQQHIIDWIYGNLVLHKTNKTTSCCSGFQGSRTLVGQSVNDVELLNLKSFQWGHLAMTYTSISTLVTLGDDLSRLDRQAIVAGVAAMQQPDGSFSASINGSENDMRFVFCASAICYMLDYWGEVDKLKMFEFIMNSLRYDYGFSQHLDGESHGGTTFCALASLHLSEQLDRVDDQMLEKIKRWCIFRQVDGFQGRPNKPVDTCYSFWIGASLHILNAFELCDFMTNRSYILETQDCIVGGFAKWPHSTTDPFHTYLALCGLSFIGEAGLMGVMPSLNISIEAYNKLKQLHQVWRHQSNTAKQTIHVDRISDYLAQTYISDYTDDNHEQLNNTFV